MNSKSTSPDLNLSTSLLFGSCFCMSESFSLDITSVILYSAFSSSVGRSLNAEMWTSVGGFAFNTHVWRALRYCPLVTCLDWKFVYLQFFSNPVLNFVIVPGVVVSASITLKFSNPKISLRTWLLWSVPDIKTRTLFALMMSLNFCARFIETKFADTTCSFLSFSNCSNETYVSFTKFSNDLQISNALL